MKIKNKKFILIKNLTVGRREKVFIIKY